MIASLHLLPMLFLQGSAANLFKLLQSTGPISWAVLTILGCFSLWSWSIIVSKLLLLKKVERESETFWAVFRKGRTFAEIGAACDTMRWTPLAPVFNAGLEAIEPRNAGVSGPLSLRARASAPTLERVLGRAAAAQLTLLEKRLPFLATTASVTPFVGLLGTVFGVMTSFADLGNAESAATIKAVAPGIADALITTGVGLFTAIPALIAYNHFLNRLRNIGGQLDDLKSEMLSYAERNGV